MISCGTTPIERFALRGCSSMSKPQIVTLPLVFTTRPARMLIKRRLARAIGAEQPEDLPARHVEADRRSTRAWARSLCRHRSSTAIRCGLRRRSMIRARHRAGAERDKRQGKCALYPNR